MTKKKPNILFIITDQQNIDSIEAYKDFFTDKAYGCHWAKTPNLNRMVRMGYSFMLSHSANPVCCPARSVMFTGRYSTETGITYNGIGIDKDVPNLGEWLEKNSDYTRVYCGKWHAGGDWNYPSVSGPRKIPGFDTLPGGGPLTGDFNDFEVSGAVRAFIKNYNNEKPFFIVAGLMNPHDICYWIPVLTGEKLVPKDDYFKLKDNRPPLPPNFDYSFAEPDAKGPVKRTEEEWRNYLYDYYRMVEKADADIGRMLDAVDSRSDETLVIFTSDHGEGAARHKRVQKWHPFEQSVKVPLIFYMPGKIKENVQDNKNLVSGIDITPTICDYAKIPCPPNCRGKSLRPLLEEKSPKFNERPVIIEFQHTNRIVRTAKYKYIKYYKFSGQKDLPFVRIDNGQAEKFVPGITKGRYVELPDKTLLFNIPEDPWELKNLAKDPAYKTILEEHEQILAEWEKKVIPGTHFDRE